MIFASFEFLFLFLPLFFTAYFLTPFRLRNWPMLLFSWAFYAWWRIDFLILLIAVTVFTWLVARAMDSAGARGQLGWRWMLFGVIGNLAVLAYFKYANFGVATFNQLIGAVGREPIGWTEIVLPIGLSFYVLQSVSYLVDVHRGVVPVNRNFLDYATYKAIFAQLIAGPIVRYAEIEDELKRRHHSLAQFGQGARIFMVGFAMKTALADTLSPLVDAAFTLAAPTFIDAWLGAVTYTLQLYFDFAGYSLMAIGLARTIGFHFPQNFDNPYLSGSIQDFWQRWHMTLSRFLRDYLYFPLGGNRKGPGRTYVNLMTIMAIGGLWHGSSWNFIFWGIWHGAMLAGHRWWTRRPGARPMPFALGNALTMLGVLVGWVLFRAKDLGTALNMYAGMLGLHGGGGHGTLSLSDALAWQATPDRLWFILIAAVFVYLPLVRGRRAAGAEPTGRWSGALPVIAPLAGFALAIVLLYSRDAVPFLYFQF